MPTIRFGRQLLNTRFRSATRMALGLRLPSRVADRRGHTACCVD
jgi:hypothetical protein